MVERFFLAAPWGCLQFVVVVFPDHTHLLFLLCRFLLNLGNQYNVETLSWYSLALTPLINLSKETNCMIYLTNSTPPAKIVKNMNFRGHGLSQCCVQICLVSDQVTIYTPYFKHK